MAKKRDKNPVVNHIQSVNMVIDYDKLAEAIVRAQDKAEDTTTGKKRYTLGTFATPLIIAFYGLSILGCIFVLATPFAVYQAWNAFSWSSVTECISSIIVLLFMLIIVVIVALYSILLWKSAKEVEAETDRNYIISKFDNPAKYR